MSAAVCNAGCIIEDNGYGFYSVVCRCGFRVVSLSTLEAAEDTLRWHRTGQPLGDES